MEAKSEHGPEMDVDSAIPDGQNGKKCNRISSCGPLILCILSMQVLNNGNIVPVNLLSRILILSHSHSILPIVNHYIVYAWLLLLTRYLGNIVQSLAVILFASKYVTVPLLPYKLCYMLSSVYRENFRPRRYRE
jgi:hypothetical protein